MECTNCKHWTQNTNWDYDNAINTGLCGSLASDVKITIEIKAGWNGGIVGTIETDEDFGCKLFEPKK